MSMTDMLLAGETLQINADGKWLIHNRHRGRGEEEQIVARGDGGDNALRRWLRSRAGRPVGLTRTQDNEHLNEYFLECLRDISAVDLATMKAFVLYVMTDADGEKSRVGNVGGLAGQADALMHMISNMHSSMMKDTLYRASVIQHIMAHGGVIDERSDFERDPGDGAPPASQVH
jgi:hypothetical protein